MVPTHPQSGPHLAASNRGASRTDRFLARFSRITSGGGFIPEIDGLRFIAITTVVLHHLATLLERQVLDGRQGPAAAEGNDFLFWLVHHGGVGVQVFFAISGFILATPFVKAAFAGGRPVMLKEYFWRRLTRLEPPFVVCMLLLYVAWTVIVPALGLTLDHPPGPANLGYSLLYAHYLRYGELSLVNGVTWSLEIEVQFYILMPLIAQVFRIRSSVARRATMVTAMICTVLVKGLFDEKLQTYHLSLTLLGYLHCFLVGLLFADIFIVDWRGRPVRGSFAWDLIGMAAVVGVLLLGGAASVSPLNIGGFLVCDLLLFYAAFRGRGVQAFMANRWIATVGGMCYSIYLWHFAVLFATTVLVIRVFEKISPRLGTHWYIIDGGRPWANFLLWAAITLPVTLAASALYFVLIERPCMKKDWPKRLLRSLDRRKADAL